MTMPHQELRAVLMAEQFLLKVARSRSKFAQEAARILRHYPYPSRVEKLFGAWSRVEEGQSNAS